VREQRRSRRIIARVPLDVQLMEPSEEAETAVINLHGALIVTPTEWPIGTILKITNQRTKCEIGGRVGWIGPQDTAGRFKVGIEFDTTVTDFWGAAYDPEGEEAP
jgi:Tfp pilus assembly protein PilZ